MNQELAAAEFYEALLEDDPIALYERAPCGYLSTTPDGLIVKVNQTFLTLTGLERDRLVGQRRFVELLTAGGRLYHETHYAPMLRMQGSAREIALEVVKADGTRLPVLVNSVLERDAHGEPHIIRTAIFDATARRAYERELLLAKQRAEESEARASLLAQTLQQTLIPPAPPRIPGLDVAAAYRPAGDGTEVGGDFYDVFQVGAAAWVLAVGDVRGKGVDAAVITALVRYSLRAAAMAHVSPADVLANVNEVLLRDPTERFCTVALARLDLGPDGWETTLSLGGHPLPLLRRGAAGPATPVGQPGSLLGVVPDPQLNDVKVPLPPGDVLVVFTDGVTEARGERGYFEDARLAEAVAAGGAPGALVDALVDEVMRYQGGSPRDDIVVLAVGSPVPT